MSILLVSNLALTATLGLLLLCGLLLIYFLLRARLGRLEDVLAEHGRGLKQLSRAIAPGSRPEAPPPIDLEPLNSSLEGIRGSLDAVEEHLDSVASDLRREREVRLREMIERRFHGRGFQSIQILGDLAGGFHGAVRVTVEGQKGGVTYKGYVALEEGQIIDEKLSSSHEIFP